MAQPKEEIVEISLWTKIVDGAVKQGFSILLLLGFNCLLLVDRASQQKENMNCRAEINELRNKIEENYQVRLDANTDALKENDRIVRTYFGKVTEPE